MAEDPHKQGWFDRPKNVRKVIYGLFMVCLAFLIIDVAFWLTGFDKHPYLKWETWPGFHAVYGFVASVILVMVAKHILRPLVMRSDNYYEKDDENQ